MTVGPLDQAPLVSASEKDLESGTEGRSPGDPKSFSRHLLDNVRIIRNDFDPTEYDEGFLKRPVVIFFIIMYVISGTVVPLIIMYNHYNDPEGGNHTLFVPDARKHRIAKAYAALVPVSLFSVPVFLPSVARVSCLPYLIISLYGLQTVVLEVIEDDYKQFVEQSLGHIIYTLVAFMWLRMLDYLDHFVHQVMLSEDRIVEEKPVAKMRNIMHSVGVTHTGNAEKDKFCAVKNTGSIAHVVHDKIWYTISTGSRFFALMAYLIVTLISDRAGGILAAGTIYYVLMATCISFKFWDQCSILIKIWMHKPFFIGDLVTVKGMGRPVGSGINGFVEHITLSYIIIRDFEAKQTYIPLGELAEAVVQNWSRRPTKPILLRFSINARSGRSEVDSLVQFAKDWIDKSPKVLHEGYKKVSLCGVGAGLQMKIIFIPAIGVHKSPLRQEFILELTMAAERLHISLAAEEPMSIFFPEGKPQ